MKMNIVRSRPAAHHESAFPTHGPLLRNKYLKLPHAIAVFVVWMLGRIRLAFCPLDRLHCDLGTGESLLLILYLLDILVSFKRMALYAGRSLENKFPIRQH